MSKIKSVPFTFLVALLGKRSKMEYICKRDCIKPYPLRVLPLVSREEVICFCESLLRTGLFFINLNNRGKSRTGVVPFG